MLIHHPNWWATVDYPDVKKDEILELVCNNQRLFDALVVAVIPPGELFDENETFRTWWKVVFIKVP